MWLISSENVQSIYKTWQLVCHSKCQTAHNICPCDINIYSVMCILISRSYVCSISASINKQKADTLGDLMTSNVATECQLMVLWKYTNCKFCLTFYGLWIVWAFFPPLISNCMVTELLLSYFRKLNCEKKRFSMFWYPHVTCFEGDKIDCVRLLSIFLINEVKDHMTDPITKSALNLFFSMLGVSWWPTIVLTMEGI